MGRAWSWGVVWVGHLACLRLQASFPFIILLIMFISRQTNTMMSTNCTSLPCLALELFIWLSSALILNATNKIISSANEAAAFYQLSAGKGKSCFLYIYWKRIFLDLEELTDHRNEMRNWVILQARSMNWVNKLEDSKEKINLLGVYIRLLSGFRSAPGHHLSNQTFIRVPGQTNSVSSS